MKYKVKTTYTEHYVTIVEADSGADAIQKAFDILQDGGYHEYDYNERDFESIEEIK